MDPNSNSNNVTPQVVIELRNEVLYWAGKVQTARRYGGTRHNSAVNSAEYFENLLDAAVIQLARVWE